MGTFLNMILKPCGRSDEKRCTSLMMKPGLSTILLIRLMRMIAFPMEDPSCRFCGFKKDRASKRSLPEGSFVTRSTERKGRGTKYPGYLGAEVPLRIQFVDSGREYFRLISIERAFFRSYLKEKENVVLQLMVVMLSLCSLCIKENSNMTKLHKRCGWRGGKTADVSVTIHSTASKPR